MAHDAHHDEAKQPATPAQVILTILAMGIPFWIALFLVARFVLSR